MPDRLLDKWSATKTGRQTGGYTDRYSVADWAHIQRDRGAGRYWFRTTLESLAPDGAPKPAIRTEVATAADLRSFCTLTVSAKVHTARDVTLPVLSPRRCKLYLCCLPYLQRLERREPEGIHQWWCRDQYSYEGASLGVHCRGRIFFSFFFLFVYICCVEWVFLPRWVGLRSPYMILHCTGHRKHKRICVFRSTFELSTTGERHKRETSH